MKKQICPKCKEPMHNVGNLDGIVYISYPAQWDETWVCHGCRLRKKIRETISGEPLNNWMLTYDLIQ